MNNFIYKTQPYVILLLIVGNIFAHSNDTSIWDFDITTYESYPFKEKSLEFRPSFNFDGKLSNDINSHYPLRLNYQNDGLISLLLLRQAWEDTKFKQKESLWRGSVSFDYEKKEDHRKINVGDSHPAETFNEESLKSIDLYCFYRNSIRRYTQRKNFFELFIELPFLYYGPLLEETILEESSEYFFDSSYYTFSRDYDRYKSYNFFIAPTLNLSFGRGRTRDVTYPAVVMHIMKDFNEKSLIKKEPKSTNILQMSQLFEKLKNKRSFDFREKRIADVKEIYTFLLSEDLVDSVSPENVMRLLDFWEYSFHQKRYSGFRNAVGIKVSGRDNLEIRSRESYILDTLIAYTDENFKKNKEKIISNLDSSQFTYYKNYNNLYGNSGDLEYGLSYYFLYQRPNNLTGQFDVYVDVDARIIQDISNNTTNKLFGQLYAHLIYYWYPSIRTTISISTGFAFNKYYWNFNIPGHEDYKRNNNGLTVGIGSECDYYVNPRLDFKFSGNMSYKRWRDLYDEKSGDNDFDYSLSFNLVYKIY